MIDDRITNKVLRTDKVELTCRNHPKKSWYTKNIEYIGARTIFFYGEDEKLSNEFLPKRATAMKLLKEGNLLYQGEAAKNTPEMVEKLNANYDELEKKYAFECSCPISDLVLSPKYDKMSEV